MKIKRRAGQAISSAEIVASIDHLLQEILLRLPIRSIIRFKSVSKHWLSLITNPQFAITSKPNPNPASGLFLPRTAFRVNPKFDYIDFNPHNPTTPPFTKLRFTKDSHGLSIRQSCNGLLLCSSFRARRSNHNYYIYNPTTKQFTTLPKPDNGTDNSRFAPKLTLAFDPHKSPHYKVVSVRNSGLDASSCQIEIYSSEIGPWRVSGEPFTADCIDFQSGVYWNGAVHWVSFENANSFHFNVDEERLGKVPMPPFPYWEGESNITYVGESCDHLHLIQTWGAQIQFDVYEMKRDFSGWFVKYHVDLAELISAFPKIICSSLYNADIYYYAFSVLTLIRGEKDEDSFLVLQIPGNAIRYNLVSGTFEKLCDIEGLFHGTTAHQYIESLCYV